MMQEAGSSQAKNIRFVASQWMICILVYGLIWTYAFNFLWFLESNGRDYFVHISQIGQFLLVVIWIILCPDWPFFALGLMVGLLVCVSLSIIDDPVKTGLFWGGIMAAAIFAMFDLTTSGLLPAFFAIAVTYFTTLIIAPTWQVSLFSRLSSSRALSRRKVIVTLVWIVSLSIPFRLFEMMEFSWALPAKVTETTSLVSPDGAYVATIHNVDPNINAYTDIRIRPRRTVLNLFCTYSASSRISGTDHIQWTAKHTLCIWRDYDAAQQQWHDLRIIYKDTRGLEEKKQEDAAKQ